MAFQFATCDVHRARGFIQSAYPDREIDFEADAVAKIMDLIRRDVVRVTDPAMHGSAQIVGSTGYTEAMHGEFFQASKAMHDAIMAMPETEPES